MEAERRGLRLSVIGALGMAALGFGFSAVTGSVAVLLDGLFSLVNFAVGLVALRVATLVRQPDDEHFHFGYAAYEPMLNLSKGLLIAFVTLIAALDAADTMLRGGREIEGGLAAIYAVIAAIGCFAISLTQRQLARRTNSPLLEVDARNWLIDGALSSAVAVAFAAVFILRDGPLAKYTPYADPTVVLLLAALTAPVPFQIIRANWNQLLGRAPAQALQHEARARVTRALGEAPGIEARLRMLETGRLLYVQVYLILDGSQAGTPVKVLDELRERISRALVEDDPDLDVDIIFTTKARYAERSPQVAEPD